MGSVLASVNWTNVLVALIAGLPAIIAAFYAALVNRKVTTPSGKNIGPQVESAALAGAANNLMLAAENGATKPADTAALHAVAESPPQVPQA